MDSHRKQPEDGIIFPVACSMICPASVYARIECSQILGPGNSIHICRRKPNRWLRKDDKRCFCRYCSLQLENDVGLNLIIVCQDDMLPRKHFSFPLDSVTFACSVKDSFGKAREERNGGEFVPANGTEGTIDREGRHLRGLSWWRRRERLHICFALVWQMYCFGSLPEL